MFRVVTGSKKNFLGPLEYPNHKSFENFPKGRVETLTLGWSAYDLERAFTYRKLSSEIINLILINSVFFSSIRNSIHHFFLSRINYLLSFTIGQTSQSMTRTSPHRGSRGISSGRTQIMSCLTKKICRIITTKIFTSWHFVEIFWKVNVGIIFRIIL